MKVLCCLLILVGFASGQLKVPEKGWKLIEEGDGKTKGERTLGWWENAEGAITVGVGWFPGIPDFGTMLGLGPDYRGADPAERPVTAEVLQKKQFGVWIEFGPDKNLKGEKQEHYWIYGQKGGVMLIVLSKKGAKFTLADWMADGLPVNRSKKKLRELHDVVTRVKGEYIRPKLKIDPSEPHEEIKKRLKRIEVRIREDGVFLFDGKMVDEKELKAVLKAAALKFEKEKEVPKIDVVLDIFPEKGVEFRFVQQVVKIAAKAGITEASFTSWELAEWSKR